MVKFLIQRPIAVTMVFIALLALGFITLKVIPVSLMPEVDIPEITVRLNSSELSVREMEDRYTTPVRRKLLQVNHLRDIQSTSMNGQAVIKLFFDYGTNLQYAYLDVNEKIDALMGQMPREFERPQVIKASATDIPAFFVSVSLKKEFSGNDDRFPELSRFCETVIKKRIEQLPEVAMADITGLEYPEIFIELDHGKSVQLGIDKATIENALKENNVSIGNIVVRDGKYIYNVRFSSAIIDRFDLENLLIAKGNRTFQLKDLATIGVRPRENEGSFVTDGIKGLSMAVIKKNDVQMETLKESFNTLKKELEKDYPRLSFKVSRDQTALLAYSISNLKNTLIAGSVLAVFIMLLFLSDYRSPLLIGISVPVSLIITLLLFYLFGLSINIISLSGLVLGVGMMIDNSIIVIDNIHQHKRGKNIDLACIVGTNEIFRPLLSSVLTTCAVFLPLLFLSGITGALFYDQAVAVSIGLLVSLAVSVTLLPVYYKLLYGKTESDSKFNRFFARVSIYSNIENAYNGMYDKAFKYRKGLFLMVCALIAGGFLAFQQLERESFPAFKQDEMLVRINWNSNISPNENRQRVNELFNHIKDKTLIFSANAGKHNYVLAHTDDIDINEAELYVKVSSIEAYETVKETIGLYINGVYPHAKISFTTPPNIFEQVFKEEKTPLVVKFWDSGQKGVITPEKFVAISNSLSKNNLFSLENRQVFQEYIHVEPDFRKLHRYNIDFNRFYYTFKKALNGFEVTSLKNGNFLVPVVVSDPAKPFAQILEKTLIENSERVSIPLIQLVTVSHNFDYKKIEGGKEGSFNQLFVHTNSKQADEAITQIKSFFDRTPGVEVAFGGMVFRNREFLNELIMVLLISILLLYFILASQFESLVQPLIILIEIPIDIAGILIVLYLTGNSINLMSLIGVVVMTGIIINDSILKIDTINRLRVEGLSVDDAIHKGGQRRLKPIVMTSLTTILALLPFMFGSDMGSVLQRPLAISVIAGMGVGTMVSLFIVPLAYRALYSFTAKA